MEPLHVYSRVNRLHHGMHLTGPINSQSLFKKYEQILPINAFCREGGGCLRVLDRAGWWGEGRQGRPQDFPPYVVSC